MWRRPIEETYFEGFRCPAVSGHTCTTVGKKMIVFGGEMASGFSNAVYVLNTDVERIVDVTGDGKAERVSTMVWSLAETTGEAPTPRRGHSATLLFSKLYIFGGVGEDRRRLNDLFVLDCETLAWSRPETSGDVPDPRDGHTMTLVGNKLMVFGGWNGRDYFSDVSSLDPKGGVWQRLNVSGIQPTGRKGHTTTLVNGTKLYVIGGHCLERRTNDLFILDTASLHWTQPEAKGNLPSPRSNHTALILDNKIFVFGGFTKGSRPLIDFRSLDTGFFNWSLPAVNGKEPDLTRARGAHAVCVVGPKVFFFGGQGERGLFGDIIVIDTESEVKKMKERYAFFKQHYPGVFEQMKAGAATKKKVYWQSGLPFIPELPFSHVVYEEFGGNGATFSGKEKRFYLLTSWSKWKSETNWILEAHPDFSNVLLVL